MIDPEHWFCPGCGEIDGPRAGMICHGPGLTGGCASVRNEVVEISHDAAQRLARAVEALNAVQVWLASPQSDRSKVEGIRHALEDPEYAAGIAATWGRSA